MLDYLSRKTAKAVEGGQSLMSRGRWRENREGLHECRGSVRAVPGVRGWRGCGAR